MSDYRYLNGHPSTCTCVNCVSQRKSGYTESRYKDVHWNDVRKFLWGRICSQRYIPEVYMCEDFARDLQDDAKKSGIDCSLVYIDLGSNSGHMCNAFTTIDEGLVYLDGTGFQEDKFSRPYTRVFPVIGQQYIPEFIFIQEGYEQQLNPMGIIKSIDVI